MKKILLTMLLVCTSCALYAASSVIIKGKVVDASTGQPIDYADVIVSDLNDKVVASGMVTNGLFSVEKVPSGDVLVMVRMMGYDPYVTPVVISMLMAIRRNSTKASLRNNCQRSLFVNG